MRKFYLLLDTTDESLIGGDFEDSLLLFLTKEAAKVAKMALALEGIECELVEVTADETPEVEAEDAG